MALLEQLVKKIEGADALDAAGDALSGPVATATGSDSIKQLLSGGWMGHQLHPMLTDVPLGAWLSATAIDVLGGRGERRAARRLIGLGVLASIPTAASGASDWVDTYGGEKRLGVAHGLGNVAAIALQCASWRCRRRGHHFRGKVLSAAGLGTALGAAYLGGHLSFGLGVGMNHTAFEFPPSDWTDVAGVDDLVDDQPKRVDAGGVAVMIVRHRGVIRALSATCVHAGGPLDEGTIEADCVICPWHGSRFRLDDGAPLRGPAAIPQPAWESRVVDGRIEVKPAS
ncbi:MAG: Rieske 2Fe-2S domain-containing protein [Actinobacteria bacterium]|nr:Rieske 2Fe-2S domain-containing protein [Actinomycetota bacterium]